MRRNLCPAREVGTRASIETHVPHSSKFTSRTEGPFPLSKKHSSKQSHKMKNRSHLKVYVLIQIVPGRVEAVMKALRRLSSVVTADSVTGPYDVVALIEVSEVRELSQLVAGAIGGIRGVTRTTTLICT